MFTKDIESQLIRQNYSPSPKIEGVKIVELKELIDDGGSFLELFRLSAGIADVVTPGEIKQINYSEVLPGVVKATHIHKKQDDVWFVPSTSRVLVGLKDIRQGSPTEGLTMRFVMGAGKSRLLIIPKEVAHGCANPWNEKAVLIYFVTQQFNPDPNACDEFRLDPEFFGKDFWQIKKG